MMGDIRICADGTAILIPFKVPFGACAADFVERETICDARYAMQLLEMGLREV